MKKSYFIFCFSLSLLTAPLFGQIKMGVKAGLNYDSFGELTATDVSVQNFNADAKTGYHFGVFGHLDLLTFYLRPELQFSKSESSFADNRSLALQKIEAPILLGYKALGPLSIFAGPAFQYVLTEKGENITLGEIKENFTVGLQLGTRLQLGRFGLGIRFERGFTDNEILILSNNDVTIEQGRVDTRAKQWIFSASYDLNLKRKRNRGDDE